MWVGGQLTVFLKLSHEIGKIWGHWNGTLNRNVCPNLHKVSVRFCWGSHLSVTYGTMGQPFVPYRLHENLGQQAADNTAKQTTLSAWLSLRGDIKSVYYSVKGNRDCGPAFRVRELKSNFSLLTRPVVPSSAFY